VNRLLEFLRGRPAWQVYVLAIIAIFVGLVTYGMTLDSSKPSAGHDVLANEFAADPLHTALKCLGVPALETLLWQVLFIDGAGRLRLARWLPIVLSALGFAVAVHWHMGLLAKLNAFWFFLVLGTVYSSQRPTSFARAFSLTVLVHWTLLIVVVAGPFVASSPNESIEAPTHRTGRETTSSEATCGPWVTLPSLIRSIG
jgi:hypothetical protein